MAETLAERRSHVAPRQPKKANGVAEWRIRLTSRHKSDVLRQYIRPVEKRKHSLTNDIGL